MPWHDRAVGQWTWVKQTAMSNDLGYLGIEFDFDAADDDVRSGLLGLAFKGGEPVRRGPFVVVYECEKRGTRGRDCAIPRARSRELARQGMSIEFYHEIVERRLRPISADRYRRQQPRMKAPLSDPPMNPTTSRDLAVVCVSQYKR